MKTTPIQIVVVLLLTLASVQAQTFTTVPAKPQASIPWSQLGAKAGADYKGDGLVLTQSQSGARLRCVFQRLQGEATPGGLWLTSTVTNTVSERFRVKATAVGRVTPCAPASANEINGQRTARPTTTLPATGNVEAADKLVRFIRPG